MSQEEKSAMSVFSMSTLSMIDDGNMRVILLILILVAVALILGGCAIAIFTFRQLRESKMLHTDRYGGK